MSLLTVLMSGFGVLLRLFVLAKIVMMSRLMMVMGGGVVMSSGLMMMITGRMLRGLCHELFLLTGLGRAVPVNIQYGVSFIRARRHR
jgi:hypothetical protein